MAAVVAALALLWIHARLPHAQAVALAKTKTTPRAGPVAPTPLECTLGGSWVVAPTTSTASPLLDDEGEHRPDGRVGPGFEGHQWRRTDTCTVAIARFLHPKRALTWALLGDSTMGRLWKYFQLHTTCRSHKNVSMSATAAPPPGCLQGCPPFGMFSRQHPNMRVLKSAGRCDMLEYLGFRRAARWIPPDIRREGPEAGNYAHTHPFCISIKSQYAIKEACDRLVRGPKGAAKTVTVVLEYLPVVQARDVMLQSPTTPTTQHTVAAYYQRHRQDVCILNAGLHEERMHDLSDLAYVANVDQFIGLLAGPCRAMIWLSTSKTGGASNYPQNNTRIARRNGMVHAMLRQHHQGVFFLDLWALSDVPGNSTLYHDNVHFIPAYYTALAAYLDGTNAHAHRVVHDSAAP